MAVVEQPAILLLAHGSPDPDWAKAVAGVVSELQARQPDRRIAMATLQPGGDAALPTVVDALVADGVTDIAIVALFLSAGGKHVKRDIPERVAALRARHPTIRLVLARGALGETREVSTALAAAAARVADEALADDDK